MARGTIEGSQIINYRGDANLALGGGAGLNVWGETDSSGISATAREVALNAFNRNMLLYQKRINDREQVRKLVDNDEITLDNILEQNRPYVEEKIKAARQYFYDNVETLMDDDKKYREYKALLADAKNAAKQANTNYLLYDGEQDELKKVTNPYDANKRKGFLNSQLEKIKGNPNAYIDPYVPISNWSPDNVAFAPVYGGATEKRVGDNIVSEQRMDTQRTLAAYGNKYMQREVTHQFVQYVDDVMQEPKRIEAVNRKLAEINQQLGLTGANVLKPISAMDRPYEVAAKIAMADNPPILSRQAYAKEQVQDDIERARLAEQGRHNRATEADARAGRAEARRWHDFRMQPTDKQDGTEKAITGVWGYIQNKITSRPEKGKMVNGGRLVINASDLPQGYKEIGGVITNENGKEVNSVLQPHTTSTGEKIFDTEFYNTKTRSKIDPMDMVGFYEKEKREAGFTGSYDAYVRALLENGFMDMELVGDGGTRATFGSALQSARLTSNRAGTKGETPVFSETDNE